MPIPVQPRRWPIALSIVLFALLAGCAQGTRLDPVRIGPCLCQGASCPTSVCDLQIDVSKQTCGGRVQHVEVLLGEQLEADTFQPGAARRTCATIPRGQTLRMSARADTDWQWVEDVSCPAAADGETVGPTLLRVLDCTEAVQTDATASDAK